METSIFTHSVAEDQRRKPRVSRPNGRRLPPPKPRWQAAVVWRRALWTPNGRKAHEKREGRWRKDDQRGIMMMMMMIMMMMIISITIIIIVTTMMMMIMIIIIIHIITTMMMMIIVIIIIIIIIIIINTITTMMMMMMMIMLAYRLGKSTVTRESRAAPKG